MKQQISRWFYYLVFLPAAFSFCAWQSWAWWSWLISAPEAKSDREETVADLVQITIEPGTAAQQIGVELEKAGLIRSAQAWKIWTKLQSRRDPNGGYQAGTYELSATNSLPTTAEQIWLGKVKQIGFTIPEGWNIQQMATYFESLGYFSAEEFIAKTRQIPLNKYAWLPEDLPHLEGFLYPDTYQLPEELISSDGVIEIMLQKFEQTALPLYREAKQNNATEFTLMEWVTMGSIVEKEAVVPEERGIIAGVFQKRLDIGMALQTDPTVEYGLGIKQTADRPLTIAEVNTPSAYNTYRNPGLPPTPIASPGIASLKASLYPEETDYIYFVARYDGTHVFSKTLRAHNGATRRIRQQRNQQRRNGS